MPLTSDVGSVVRSSVSNRPGAGEPSGEPVPPPGILGAMEGDLPLVGHPSATWRSLFVSQR
jgi:hypothetical protein